MEAAHSRHRDALWLSHAAYFDDIFVGCIGGKVEGDAVTGKKLYITVLGVLAPYRSRGVGENSAQSGVAFAFLSRTERAPHTTGWRESIPTLTAAGRCCFPALCLPGSELLGQVMTSVAAHPEIKEVYMHVWTANEEAARFYQRHGFAVCETIAGYYRGITPPDCLVMRKAVNEGVLDAALAAADLT